MASWPILPSRTTLRVQSNAERSMRRRSPYSYGPCSIYRCILSLSLYPPKRKCGFLPLSRGMAFGSCGSWDQSFYVLEHAALRREGLKMRVSQVSAYGQPMMTGYRFRIKALSYCQVNRLERGLGGKNRS